MLIKGRATPRCACEGRENERECEKDRERERSAIMYARIYVENYSREEGNELTSPRNYYGPAFCSERRAPLFQQ